MARLLFLTVCALLIAGALASSACYEAASEAECAALGSCVAVRGEHCKDEMTPPPCGLQFTIDSSEDCCDEENLVEDGTHIKFLGCEPAGAVCGIQCVQSVDGPTAGEVFVLWEGCAFNSDQWKDVSESDECKSCYDEACPSRTSHLDFLLLLAFIPLGGAVLIAIVIAVVVLALVLRRTLYRREADPEAYQPVPLSIEMVPTETAEEASAGPQAVDEDGVIQVRRLADGNIRIPMADGSFRIVSADAYQKLYLKQQKKRYEQYKQSQPQDTAN